MAKRRKCLTGKVKSKRSRKTAKRLAAKAEMLAAKEAKRKGKKK